MFSTAFLDLPPLAHAAGTVTLPGSKSISNRVLLLAALSEGTTTIHDLLESDDTRVMLFALRTLGCGVDESGGTVRITGLGGELPSVPSRFVPRQRRHRHAPTHGRAGGLGRRLWAQRRAPHARTPHWRLGGCTAPTGLPH